MLTFANEVALSNAATASGSGVSLTFIGAELAQVLSAPAAGEFTLSVTSPASFGSYGFAAADAGRTILILDVPDANPADVLQDFLTNPYYGLAQFPAERIGDLSTYRRLLPGRGPLRLAGDLDASRRQFVPARPDDGHQQRDRVVGRIA